MKYLFKRNYSFSMFFRGPNGEGVCDDAMRLVLDPIKVCPEGAFFFRKLSVSENIQSVEFYIRGKNPKQKGWVKCVPIDTAARICVDCMVRVKGKDFCLLQGAKNLFAKTVDITKPFWVKAIILSEFVKS